MDGTHDLAQVHRMQEQLRREAAEHRLATRSAREASPKAPARRVFGLRLSPA